MWRPWNQAGPSFCSNHTKAWKCSDRRADPGSQPAVPAAAVTVPAEVVQKPDSSDSVLPAALLNPAEADPAAAPTAAAAVAVAVAAEAAEADSVLVSAFDADPFAQECSEHEERSEDGNLPAAGVFDTDEELEWLLDSNQQDDDQKDDASEAGMPPCLSDESDLEDWWDRILGSAPTTLTAEAAGAHEAHGHEGPAGLAGPPPPAPLESDEAEAGEEPGKDNAARSGHSAPRPRRPDFAKSEFTVGLYGKLRVYKHTGVLVAICGNPNHLDCRMERKLAAHPSVKSPNTARAGQGRPLGLLVHWLKSQFQYKTHAAHIHSFKHSHDLRLEARNWFLDSLPPGDKEEILSLERPRRDGEDSEPQKIQ